MPVGNVVRYDPYARTAIQKAWDNPQAGAYMWALGTKNYSPTTVNATFAAMTGFYVQTGAGAPINVTNRTVAVSPTDVKKAVLKADLAAFGQVPVAVKYLVCVQLATPGTLAATDALCFYVDLDTTSATAELPANSIVNYGAADNIWVVAG